jgi:hypothetical protein
MEQKLVVQVDVSFRPNMATVNYDTLNTVRA